MVKYICVLHRDVHFCMSQWYTEGRYSYNIQIDNDELCSLLRSMITQLVGEGIGWDNLVDDVTKLRFY